MKRERITPEDALGAVRAAGGRDVADVETLILESDGSISTALRR